MHSRIYSLFSALTALVLMFTLAVPSTAFADEGQPGDPTPEATEEAPAADGATEGEVEEELPPPEIVTEEIAPEQPAVEETVTEEVVTEEAAPVEVETEEAVSEEVATEETVTEEPAVEEAVTEEAAAAEALAEEPVVSEETVADVVEVLDEVDAVLVDPNGEPVSLASEEAMAILTNPDPYIVRAGVTHRFLSDCSGQPIDANNTCTPSATPIQAAIDFANDGETVVVEAGDYYESPNITKAVTLSGANAGIDPNTGTRVAESVIYGLLTIISNDVTIDGFYITNPTGGRGIYSGNADNITITNNIITNVGNSDTGTSSNFGVLIEPTLNGDADNIEISHNLIENLAGNVETVAGIGILQSIGNGDVTNLVIEKNVIQNISTGPTKGAYGIIINHGSGSGYTGETVAPQILNNTIDNISGGWAHGIGLEGDTPNALVQGNTISNVSAPSGDGVGIFIEDNTYGNTVTIGDNTFTSNTVQVAAALGNVFDVAETLAGNTFDRAVTVDHPGNSLLPAIWSSIQAAVGFAVDDDTVYVEAGNYEEQLVIDKSITLTGAGASSTTVQAPVVLTNDPDGTKSIIVVTGPLVNAMISGFTITGPGPTNCGSLHFGIYVRDGAYAYIHDNSIEDVRDNPFSGCQNGVAIEVGRQSTGQTGTALIEDNDISGYQKNGITVDNVGSSATILSNNLVIGAGATATIAQNGIQISRGATGTIDGNTIMDNHWIQCPTCTPWTSTGVLLYQAGDDVVVSNNTIQGNQTNLYVQDTDDVEITGNIISDSTQYDNIDIYNVDGAIISDNVISNATMDGIWVGNSANITITGNEILNNGLTAPYPEAAGVHLWDNDLSGVSITGNTFEGNLNGVYNEDAETVNATGNWWGSASGPYDDSTVLADACALALENADGTGDPVSGCVSYSPWLTADPATDADSDGVDDAVDNCPATANTGQSDSDGDGVGNACDATPNGDEGGEGDGGDGDGGDDDGGDDDDGGGTTTTGGPIIPVTGGVTEFIDPAIDLDAALDEFANVTFPLESVEGEYQFACVLESVTTLDPANYITVGDQVITVVGQCSYLANGVKQTITLALGEGFTPGGVVTSTFDGTDEAYANFATTGDPLALGNFMVPVGVEQTDNVTE